MEYFKEKEYVINLVITPEKEISFTYASRQIKELLTDAGKMLKIYTYHKIKDCGYFDDVVSGLGIEWQGTEVKSEFDCILTKEFHTLFIECRAQADIGQEPYFKLTGLAQQFGINATAVLVADTEGESRSENVPANIINRKRGRMMDVVTMAVRRILPEELLSLTEKIAENVHDVWAAGRISEGWSYGAQKDAEKKITPLLVPYQELPESEKDYDRNTALETIKFMVKMGYHIAKPLPNK